MKKYFYFKLIRYLFLGGISLYFFVIPLSYALYKVVPILLENLEITLNQTFLEKEDSRETKDSSQKNTQNILVKSKYLPSTPIFYYTNVLLLLFFFWIPLIVVIIVFILEKMELNLITTGETKEESGAKTSKFDSLYLLLQEGKMAQLKYEINALGKAEENEIVLGKRWNLFKAYCCEKEIKTITKLSQNNDLCLELFKFIKQIDHWIQIHTSDLYLPNTNIFIWIPALIAVFASVIPIYQFIESYRASIKQEQEKIEIAKIKQRDDALQALINFNKDKKPAKSSNFKVRLAIQYLLENRQNKNKNSNNLILNGINLDYANLSNTDLQNINLEKARLIGAELINSDLSNANMVRLNYDYNFPENPNEE